MHLLEWLYCIYGEATIRLLPKSAAKLWKWYDTYCFAYATAFLLLYEVSVKENVMKLLIVDDEELTRTGVIASIDWKSLGIDEVFQADDGVNGLETARIHKPEIILCDVRMPRMDGITMLERVENFLPDSVPIFMSGYSDKEYLKAAIKLKAVNYIEKPLNPVEIQAAVKEAIHLFVQKQHSHRGESLQSLKITGLQIYIDLPGTSMYLFQNELTNAFRSCMEKTMVLSISALPDRAQK